MTRASRTASTSSAPATGTRRRRSAAPSDDVDSILYWTNIHRKRLHPGPSHNPPPQQNCDPNYSGCLDPNASDYDCIGGSGDGPRYTGAVRVLGDDHYDLDRDGDGVGCEDD
jgi:hypothetical protein